MMKTSTTIAGAEISGFVSSRVLRLIGMKLFEHRVSDWVQWGVCLRASYLKATATARSPADMPQTVLTRRRRLPKGSHIIILTCKIIVVSNGRHARGWKTYPGHDEVDACNDQSHSDRVGESDKSEERA